ncbi:MAG: hypothetical protein K8J08_04455, partial [Thermoanaerobaculia bacterium]|nr:hypothetical protein [Thermoanaerobaculia bacterium]
MLRQLNANPCPFSALDRGDLRHPSLRPLLWLTLGMVIIGTLLLTGPGAATIHTVGTDVVACDFTNLATAIGAAVDGDVLHLEAINFLGALNSNFNIYTKSLTLEGGYADCSAVSSTGTSTLTGGGSDSVLEIGGNGDHTILLQHLIITGGEDDADDGGGIEIRGSFDVTLLDVDVSGNDSELGAGIYIDGTSGASLLLGEGSRISQNNAAIDGGGIYCV